MRFGRIFLLALPVTSVMFFFVACGGSNDAAISSSDSGTDGNRGPGDIGTGGDGSVNGRDGGSDSSVVDASTDAPVDAPPDAPPTDCPFTPPTGGADCTTPIECTYGSDPRFSCRTHATCKSGKWTVLSPPCSVPPTCPAEPPPPDAGCSPSGITCGYAEVSCLCRGCSGGIVCSDPTSTFHCSAPPKGCPTAPPNLGTACSKQGNKTCDYGGCNGGITVECNDGVWTQTFTPCPL